MTSVLVCPFGDANLLVTLFELLRSRFPGRYEVTYLSFTEYDRAMYRRTGARHIHLDPGEGDDWFPEDVLSEVVRFSEALAERSGGVRARGTLRRAANHYGRLLDGHFAAERFDQVVEFNGRMNLVIAALDAVADLRGVPKLVFEQGLFRPDYLTIDGRGVNRRNSIDSLETLLSPAPLAYQTTPLYRDLASLLPLPRDAVRDFKRAVPPLALAAAYLRMKLQPSEYVHLRDAEGRDLLEAAVRPRRRRAAGARLDAAMLEGYRYRILCPLQVETDTQILLHSPRVPTMSRLVDAVAGAVARYNASHDDRACVLFKTHPMAERAPEPGHADSFLVAEPAIPELLRLPVDLVVTINSTVGIDAIDAGIPVITLGEAFYALPGIVSASCTELAALPLLLDRALAGGTTDRALQRRFIEALRTRYQVRLH